MHRNTHELAYQLSILTQYHFQRLSSTVYIGLLFYIHLYQLILNQLHDHQNHQHTVPYNPDQRNKAPLTFQNQRQKDY
ncbi:hypothetical protein D3C78_1694970 [compost metagenome]